MVAPDSDHGANAILSPDGTRLVYVSQSKLFIRPLDQTKATELSGTDNAQAPFFSPDGRGLPFSLATNCEQSRSEAGRWPTYATRHLAPLAAAVGVRMATLSLQSTTFLSEFPPGWYPHAVDATGARSRLSIAGPRF